MKDITKCFDKKILATFQLPLGGSALLYWGIMHMFAVMVALGPYADCEPFPLHCDQTRGTDIKENGDIHGVNFIY